MDPRPPEPSRTVSRFRPAPPADDPVYNSVPDDGLCLNAFVLLSDAKQSGRILMGKVDPAAPWKRIGGISAQRLKELPTKWMLPSRQLFLFEAPQEAAQVILTEQLELPRLPLVGPEVHSEAWQRPTPAGAGRHWDLHFIFRGQWPADLPVRASPWTALEFVEPSRLDKAEVGRGHLDVLALAGLRPA